MHFNEYIQGLSCIWISMEWPKGECPAGRWCRPTATITMSVEKVSKFFILISFQNPDFFLKFIMAGENSGPPKGRQKIPVGLQAHRVWNCLSKSLNCILPREPWPSIFAPVFIESNVSSTSFPCRRQNHRPHNHTPTQSRHMLAMVKALMVDMPLSYWGRWRLCPSR